MKNVIFVFLSAVFISLGTNLMSIVVGPTCQDLKKRCQDSKNKLICDRYRSQCSGSNFVPGPARPGSKG